MSSMMALCQNAARSAAAPSAASGSKSAATAAAAAAAASGSAGGAKKRGGGGAKRGGGAGAPPPPSPPGGAKRAPRGGGGGGNKKPPVAAAAVYGSDGIPRCAWSAAYVGAAAEEYVRYHDEEWGQPLSDDSALFELLLLESAQAGLSWATVLAKRAAYRAAFPDAATTAALAPAAVEALIAGDSGIVRHRGKVEAAVNNARCFLRIQAAHGSFANWLWGFVPGKRPVVNAWTEMAQLPARTAESDRLADAMKREGFKFVGPTTCYAFMQGAGLVNDHLVSCHCHPTHPQFKAAPHRTPPAEAAATE